MPSKAIIGRKLGMTRYNYNRQVTPPAPFVNVTMAQPDGAGRPPVTKV